ncbi:MAG: ABC transporter permease [Firmicutes bacterium]|nr:ABC transporter permease [Bacillota bacterium]
MKSRKSLKTINKKMIYILVFAGTFITIFSILFSNFIYSEFVDMNGTYGFNKILVRVKNETKEADFAYLDIKNLKRELDTEKIAYTLSHISKAGHGNRYRKARIRGTNSQYQYFVHLNIKDGNFFTEQIEDERAFTAVIDTELAWDIFNSCDVVGMDLNMLGRDFKIIGVVDKHGVSDRSNNVKENMIEKLADDGIPNVYVPINVLLELQPQQGIDLVQIYMPESDILGKNIDKVKEALQRIGKHPDDYNMLDFYREKILLYQKHKLQLFFIGLIVIFVSIMFLRNEVIKSFKHIKNSLGHHYFIESFRLNIWEILKCLALVITISIGVIVIWYNITFDLYIPPKYIAEQLIDTGFYSELIETEIQQRNLDIGYMPELSERWLMKAHEVNNFLFWIGVLLGYPFVFIGAAQMIQQDGSLSKAIRYYAYIVVFSVIATILIGYYYGLTLFFKPKLIILIWINIICITLYFRYIKNVKDLKAIEYIKK